MIVYWAKIIIMVRAKVKNLKISAIYVCKISRITSSISQASIKIDLDFVCASLFRTAASDKYTKLHYDLKIFV